MVFSEIFLAQKSLVLNKFSSIEGLSLPIKTCIIKGSVCDAICPTTPFLTGTFLQPKIFRPCFFISDSKTPIQ